MGVAILFSPRPPTGTNLALIQMQSTNLLSANSTTDASGCHLSDRLLFPPAHAQPILDRTWTRGLESGLMTGLEAAGSIGWLFIRTNELAGGCAAKVATRSAEDCYKVNLLRRPVVGLTAAGNDLS